MAFRVDWSPRALDDVDDIAAYIAQDSAVYARNVVRRIFKAAASLTSSPKRGRVVPEFGDDSIRELFVSSYRMIYRVIGEHITIGTVIHGARLVDISLKP